MSFKGNQPSYHKKQEQLYKLCHDYLVDNFHKFSDSNKLKVALFMAGKCVVQKVEGGTVIFNKTPDIHINGNQVEHNVGNRITGYSREASADTA